MSAGGGGGGGALSYTDIIFQRLNEIFNWLVAVRWHLFTLACTLHALLVNTGFEMLSFQMGFFLQYVQD